MKTKWRKVGNEWRRGPLRVWGFWDDDYNSTRWLAGANKISEVCYVEFNTIGYPTPEAAMRAADRWAAKMLKALKKLEGDKTRRKP